jgi:hypothetical protein
VWSEQGQAHHHSGFGYPHSDLDLSELDGIPCQLLILERILAGNAHVVDCRGGRIRDRLDRGDDLAEEQGFLIATLRKGLQKGARALFQEDMGAVPFLPAPCREDMHAVPFLLAPEREVYEVS